MKNLSMILVLVLWCAVTQAQTLTPEQKKVDKLFERWNKPNSPGVAIAVLQNGKVAYTQGYGKANLEYDIPITPKTVFHAASLSKQFTAFAILLLEKRGKLSLNDPISKYFPKLPGYGKKITLKHLLTHTSGLRDQWRLLQLAGWRLDDVITKAHVLDLIHRQQALDFEPGSKFSYSNSGFTLLAEIVEKASGKTFAEFTKVEIFEPLGMKNSQFYDDHEKIVANRAYSYKTQRKGKQKQFKKSVLNYAVVGATSLFTTAEDLSLWAQNFKTLKIGDADIFKKMHTKTKLNSGRKIDVGLGQFLGSYQGLPVVYHTGSDAGYRLSLIRFPEQNFAAMVLSNVASFDRDIVASIADIYIKSAYKKEKENKKKRAFFEHDPKRFIKLSKAELKKYEGTYWETAEWYDRKIYLKEDGALYYYRNKKSETKLLPISKNAFKMIGDTEDVTVTFNKNSKGEDRISLKINDRTPLEYVKYQKNVPLDDYLGSYKSPELSTDYSLVIENNQLMLKHFRTGKIALKPVRKNIFKSGNYLCKKLEFIRNKKGQVIGFEISNWRLNKLRFTKVKAAK
ncbi:MAG TPA: penicillin-binding protein [Microscillaceae bacterium]|nr:penicillin-binding protein [Microscillaceae bacterium]